MHQSSRRWGLTTAEAEARKHSPGPPDTVGGGPCSRVRHTLLVRAVECWGSLSPSGKTQ